MISIKRILLIIAGLLLPAGIYAQIKPDLIQEGDLIFQTSLSAQSKAIQLATQSKYSHCGIIFKDKNGYYVLEAISRVKRTPLAQWIARGQGKNFVVKRLKNADQVLSAAMLVKMKSEGRQLTGKAYDLTFEWSDTEIYCSELIWKIYERSTGIRIGKLEKLRDFDLSDDIVKKKMKSRYGNRVPMNETVISPVSIFNSKLLKTVNLKESV